MADQTNIIEKIKNDFRRMESVYSNGMNDLRLNALANFSRMGFPTRKHEEWKYTDISPILKTSFSLPGSFAFETKKEEILARLNIKEDVILVVLENGRLNPSDTPSLPEGLEYRFVYRHLIIRDTQANLVIDFMPAALPAA